MNRPSGSLSAAAAAFLVAAIMAVSAAAQAPQNQQAPPAGAAQGSPSGPAAGASGGAPHEPPAPKNLKVLPKSLTGKQVHDVMEGWSGGLGVHCDTCHTKVPGKVGPNGRPVLNFADDSKKEKDAARLMFTMTRKINDDYVSMVPMDHDEDSNEAHAAHKVTCGTCHRGHLKPEAYIPPKENASPHPAAPEQKPSLPR